jgi:hypothetical protein
MRLQRRQGVWAEKAGLRSRLDEARMSPGSGGALRRYLSARAGHFASRRAVVLASVFESHLRRELASSLRSRGPSCMASSAMTAQVLPSSGRGQSAATVSALDRSSAHKPRGAVPLSARSWSLRSSDATSRQELPSSLRWKGRPRWTARRSPLLLNGCLTEPLGDCR